MLARRDEARDWLGRAAARWRESWEHAPSGSWGRPVGVLKAALIVGDAADSEDVARWVLNETGAAAAESPIGRYAAAVAYLTLDDGVQGLRLAETLRRRDDFPDDVAEALFAIGARSPDDFAEALESVLVSFETRDKHVEGMPVADTVLALNALAANRSVGIELRSSSVLPPVS
jgi:hypothetical protein